MTEAKERESLAPGLPVSLVDHPPPSQPPDHPDKIPKAAFM